MPVQDAIEAANDAGRQIIRDGRMKQETLKTASRELGPIDVYLEEMNTDFRKALNRQTRS
jgi:hypothetical protein